MFTQAEVFTRCDKIGEVGVRERINSGEWNEKNRIRHAKEWLRIQEESRNEQPPSERLDLVKSQLDIANAQLAITKLQLQSAKKQRNTAIIGSIVIAVIAVIIIVAITI